MPRRLLSIALGALALVTTTAVLCTQIVLSLHIDRDSPGKPAAAISAVFESALLALLAWLFATSFLPAVREQSERTRGIIFGLGIMACTLATITSIVALVYLSKSTQDNQNSIVIGSSTALGLSIPSQLIFMVVHFISARMEAIGASWSFHKDEEAGRSRKINLKAIRYSQTLPTLNYSQEISRVALRGRSNSTGGKSAAETFRSSMTSVSQIVRPVSSKSRLVSSKEKSRSASIDSIANRSSGDDTFDSWDTSAVDVHNRQAVLEISSPTQPKARGLETIPASPMASRSPTPDSLYDLEPPHLQGRNRSRSFSPVSLSRDLRDLPPPTTPGSSSEAHIHPLFRSNSPDPHPLATPGTSVVAAPEGARVIVHRASNRSLNRMRSDSMPVIPSPLSRQGSIDDIGSLKMQRSELGPITGSGLEEPSSQTETERKMTPPVPEWLLSGRAGTR